MLVTGNFLQEFKREDDLVAVTLKMVPAWSVSRFEWEIKPSQRGQLPIENPKLMTAFPFGFHHAEKEIDVTGNTLVWPASRELDAKPDERGRQISIDGDLCLRAGAAGETIGVREFRQGDSMRNVHWSQTAKLNELIVRERQACSSTTVRVVVDLTPDFHEGEDAQSTYENCIRVAASVCKYFHQRRAIVDLECLGLGSNHQNRAGNRFGLPVIMDFLALLPQIKELRSESNIGVRKFGGREQLTMLIVPANSADHYSLGKNTQSFCVDIDGNVVAGSATVRFSENRNILPPELKPSNTFLDGAVKVAG